MKNKKPSNPAPKPTPQQLPTLDEFDKALRGVDLWEAGKPPEVVARCVKITDKYSFILIERTVQR